ncbi:MAG: hypothetical protein O2819_04725 [Planctomycetota bacterium]|nr:hypothetical protein [Planctomycetota bacterium]MDA1105140.1 hypothetical protein [Planctomycetota bacterium]
MEQPQPKPPAERQTADAQVSDRSRLGLVRIAAAMVVAVLADTIGAPLGEVGGLFFDLGVGLVLTAVLGWRIEILIAFIFEAIPSIGLFPSWIVAVPIIAGRDYLRVLSGARTPQ